MIPFRRVLSIFVFVVFFAAVLYSISQVQDGMEQIRDEKKLVPQQQITEGAPPIVSFTTVALGSFRGLVADWLWLRSRRMQDKGNYFEMVQLSSWIVKLQPRFTGVAAYLAWNMAYNVSVTFSEPEDRWRWVQRGIELLRDQSLRYNPGDPDLYQELAWIYQHKLGMTYDEAHKYYKKQLAKQITEAVGEYPPDWEKLAAVPYRKDAFLQKIENSGELQSALEAQETTIDEIESVFREEGDLPDDISSALTDIDLKSHFERFLRHRWLRDEYRLDPEWILQLNREYGELDWRLPEAHALYWGRKGTEIVGGELFSSKWARIIYQSLQQAFQQGRLVDIGDMEYFSTTPNINLVDAVNHAYTEVQEEYDEDYKTPLMSAPYKNFMKDAITYLYTFGEDEKAQEYLEKGRDKWPDDDLFQKSVTEFVLDRLGAVRDWQLRDVRPAVQSYLFRACQALAYGDKERAASFEAIAKRMWQEWMRDEPPAGDQALPPFNEMKKTVLKLSLERMPEDVSDVLKEKLSDVEYFTSPEDNEIEPSSLPQQ